MHLKNCPLGSNKPYYYVKNINLKRFFYEEYIRSSVLLIIFLLFALLTVLFKFQKLPLKSEHKTDALKMNLCCSE